MNERAETGPMRFGDDWNGVFIRGDNALMFAMALRRELSKPASGPMDLMNAAMLEGLANTLASVHQHSTPKSDVQMMKSFSEAKQ